MNLFDLDENNYKKIVSEYFKNGNTEVRHEIDKILMLENKEFNHV